jgi:1-acyl-sn-glycerol-3-phosphate acyltransferase
VKAGVDELVGRTLCGLVNVICGAASRWVNCEPSTRQRVYYGNHSSHLDIIVLWSCLPPEVRRLTRPAAARDYWETSPVRRYLVHRVFNAILIERAQHGGSLADAAHSFEAVLEGMGNRFSLIIFPEGTRGAGEVMGSFKSGLYHIARSKPDLELVPVFMENLNRILPKGEILPVPLIGSISFGPPLTLTPGEGKVAFLQRARQAILDLANV